MAWGGLNPALTSWRDGINELFPDRGTTTDGGYADKVHGSTSQHQPDADGSVDAFDMDVNLLGSSNDTGNAMERRLIEALKLDFEADRRSHLWIHLREISNEDVRDWAERTYGGASAHDHHVHWESEQRYERDGSPWKFTNTIKALESVPVALTPADKNWIDQKLDEAAETAATKAAQKVWATTLDVNIDPKQKASPQKAGNILRYLSPEGHQTRALLNSLITLIKGGAK